MERYQFEPKPLVKGNKVLCVNNHDCGPYSSEEARAHLTVGHTYTLDSYVIHDWYTNLYLKEFPRLSFNSVWFNVKITPEGKLAIDNERKLDNGSQS